MFEQLMGAVWVKSILICSLAIFLGIILGNSGVWFFNKIPGKWLVDYGEKPEEELLNPTRQRINSVPWKYVFTGFFIVVGIKMGLSDSLYAFPSLIVMWLLLEMAIADIKYKIIPDQLIMLLVVSAIGFIGKHTRGPMECLYGALIGFGVLAFLGVVSKFIYRKSTIGGGDIKLFGALGLIAGVEGILFIMVATTFLSSGHFISLLIRKKAKWNDSRAMVPYIAISTVFYMVFFHQLLYGKSITLIL